MPLQVLSLGFRIDTWKPQCGVVHSAFDHAVNLLMDGELWTLLGAPQHDAPFGIRLASGDSPRGLDVRAADRVHVRAGYMSVGPWIVDCRTATRWAPARWGAPARGLLTRVSVVEQTARHRAWSGSAEIANDVAAALLGSESAELARAVRRSVGRGPGLTPAGDDVLVGMLTVLTAGASGPAAAATASRLVGAVAAVPHSTPDVSRHLLNQAARGLPGRALHDLGKALWEGAPDEALAGALESVLDTGCTSGADGCLGLAAACRIAFLAAERPADEYPLSLLHEPL
jgi:hypothetical protein